MNYVLNNHADPSTEQRIDYQFGQYCVSLVWHKDHGLFESDGCLGLFCLKPEVQLNWSLACVLPMLYVNVCMITFPLSWNHIKS